MSNKIIITTNKVKKIDDRVTKKSIQAGMSTRTYGNTQTKPKKQRS